MQRNQKSNCQHPLDHQKSKRVLEKHLLLLYWLCQSFWLCGSQQTVEYSERWEYQTTWPASWEICIQVKKQQLELDVEQQTGSNLGKEYVNTVYCHSAYLTYMQSISYEMLGCKKHKLESRLLGEISITSDTQMTPPLWQSEEELKSLLMKVKEESEKVGLKLNRKLRSRIWSHHFMANRWGKEWKQWQTLFWGLPKSL